MRTGWPFWMSHLQTCGRASCGSGVFCSFPNHLKTTIFWTEKLSDAWLGYAFPLYLGACNVPAFFPEGGIPASRHDEANICTIRNLLDSDDWERRLPALRRCRKKTLVTNNLFARLDRLIKESDEQPRCVPSLEQAVPSHAVGRWTAALRRAVRFGFYNPFAAG